MAATKPGHLAMVGMRISCSSGTPDMRLLTPNRASSMSSPKSTIACTTSRMARKELFCSKRCTLSSARKCRISRGSVTSIFASGTLFEFLRDLELESFLASCNSSTSSSSCGSACCSSGSSKCSSLSFRISSSFAISSSFGNGVSSLGAPFLPVPGREKLVTGMEAAPRSDAHWLVPRWEASDLLRTGGSLAALSALPVSGSLPGSALSARGSPGSSPFSREDMWAFHRCSMKAVSVGLASRIVLSSAKHRLRVSLSVQYFQTVWISSRAPCSVAKPSSAPGLSAKVPVSV
mmetsp:Transcript_82045/g.196718  ORF Transcript_82045/g.196718 Transcript_82045/m.196718 type:complete len:291 (+) Transcript_82045:451-1323(+)